jgi:hypothetical protein
MTIDVVARQKARAVIAKLLLQYADDERPTLSEQEPKRWQELGIDWKAFRDGIAVQIEAIDLLRDDLLAWAREGA